MYMVQDIIRFIYKYLKKGEERKREKEKEKERERERKTEECGIKYINVLSHSI